MQRKLTVILSADVAGYSGMMERDEAGTLGRLKENRTTIFDPQVAAHGGRQFKLMGDGALVEFGSVVAAVNCALAIQAATGKGEGLRYRIGINLGEVIVEGDDIYGEGVNVAARIQALAPVGGVALSRVVKDQAEGKALCVFDDMGEHVVKNIERPVHVFKVSAAQPEGQKVEDVRKLSICVLPFTNMSGEAEQEYFSDGISEDIITDLSKVKALWVAARNTAFTFKGKHVDVPQVARQLKVSHVLEGSVRKSGGRVRITAQLIDAGGGHVWAERYDRDLNDIFALQDEISQAIVAALKLQLLPEEKKAIEQRGTTNLEAYNLYLMARQHNITGTIGNAHRSESIIRLCKRATEIDPNYALAWALMATAQGRLRHERGAGDNGLAAAERALSIDPNLAEAHAAKSEYLKDNARYDEARVEIEMALRLDPESYEVNYAAARLSYATRRIPDAIRYFEKAAGMMESDFGSVGLLFTCYKAIGDQENARRSSLRVLERVEKVIAVEPDNGSAMGFAVGAHATLGNAERAKEMAKRALLLDPDNKNMRYNFACGFVQMGDIEAALDLLEPVLAQSGIEHVNWTKKDSDLDPIREHPRYRAMIAAAEARLAESS
ncbi:MAG: adenylate/guanylate cyclase domain-containing protein [Alphaproteobacteria bacterium]|nr:adenylate/guanylate cyclase domain-containing protein [Alphaproteobacteria bacterium]